MFRLIAVFVTSFLLCLGASSQPVEWVFDLDSQQVVVNSGDDRVRPIASLSKLMTAMVTLDDSQDLERELLIDRKVGTALPAKQYTRYELLHALLVHSDNSAAETLAADYPGGRSAFMTAMNNKAMALGMFNTNFDDPSGLSPLNVSTASEVGKMLQATQAYHLIKSISTLKQTRIPTKKNRFVEFFNTNHAVLSRFDNIEISKTGFTNPAGFCMGLIVSRSQRQFIIVVLGEVSKVKRTATINKIMRQLG